MKTILGALLIMCTLTVTAAPLRVALLDFEQAVTMAPEVNVPGTISPAVLAAKGAFTLETLLANQAGFVLIDRRDFMKQLERRSKAEAHEGTATPSFLRAAQALNADVAIRGVLLSYAPGREVVDQGGIKTEFQSLNLRVVIQAFDTGDGTIIAAEEGSANRSFRQSAAHQTVISEDEVLQLLQAALGKALPGLTTRLQTRSQQLAKRRKVHLSITTGETDPALVEIDGLLVGSTPLKDFQVYAGDHVLTLGKAGYRDISKRILIETDTQIEVTLFRTELSASEIKETLDKARINILSGTAGGLEPVWIINPAGGSRD